MQSHWIRTLKMGRDTALDAWKLPCKTSTKGSCQCWLHHCLARAVL